MGLISTWIASWVTDSINIEDPLTTLGGPLSVLLTFELESLINQWILHTKAMGSCDITTMKYNNSNKLKCSKAIELTWFISLQLVCPKRMQGLIICPNSIHLLVVLQETY